MTRTKLINASAIALILFSAFAILSVSVMAFVNPQSVMDLVQVKLPNTDAYSSIRGVYGGVGLTIVVTLIYLAFADTVKGLVFLILLWGFYALSRFITMLVDGPLGAFGQQWLLTESLLCLLAVMLVVLYRQAGIQKTMAV
ncbi:hypothetical protein GCM10023189_56230 [Nibrella saemangeumensis]|uniref:DUF4345 domain-containing protein n=1 Tax=Nibrella saemangeumensis TaxID=1084526 RepID=A0ABP8NLL3_9BACT